MQQTGKCSSSCSEALWVISYQLAQIREYLRLWPREFNDTLTPHLKVTPLEFIFPRRFWVSASWDVKVIYPGWNFSFHQLEVFQIWPPVTNLASISGQAGPPHLYWGKGWLGRGQTQLSLLPPHLGALAELLWHEIQAAVSMVTSRFGSTSFTQRGWVMNFLVISHEKTPNIQAKYTIRLRSPLYRLMKNRANMAQRLLTPKAAGEYAE